MVEEFPRLAPNLRRGRQPGTAELEAFPGQTSTVTMRCRYPFLFVGCKGGGVARLTMFGGAAGGGLFGGGGGAAASVTGTMNVIN